jgi:hypothetical protein
VLNGCVLARVDHALFGSSGSRRSDFLNISTATDQFDNLSPQFRPWQRAETLMTHGTPNAQEEQLRTAESQDHLGRRSYLPQDLQSRRHRDRQQASFDD